MKSQSAPGTRSGIKKVSANCNLCGADDYVQLTIGHEHEYDNTTDDTFNVVRCKRCELVYLNPRPDVATLSAIYPPNYYSYNQKALRDSANPNSILQRLRYKGFQAKVQTSLKLATQADKSIAPGVGSTSHPHADGSISDANESTADAASIFPARSTPHSPGSTSPANGVHCLAHESALTSAKAPAAIRVLDIGCGDGHTLDLYRRHPGIETYGVDFNSGAIALAKQNGHVVTVGRFEEVDLQSDFFDLVTATHVIEHVPDPAEFMRKAFAVLKPGGIFWLETPNIESLDARLFREKHWGGYHFPRHWFFFSKRTMLSLAEKIGFQTEVVDFVPNAIFWFWTMHSILLEKFPQARKTVDALFPPIEFQKDSWSNFLRICFFCAIDVAIKAATGETSNMIVALRKPAR